MCSETFSELIDYLEGGGAPIPIFFSREKCQGNRWPTTFSNFTEIHQRFKNTDLCPNPLRKECIIPMIRSMILPNNIKINFVANDVSTKGGSTKAIEDRIFEIGEYNMYSNVCKNNKCEDMGTDKQTNPLRWNSRECINKGNSPCSNSISDNCRTKVDSKATFDKQTGKLMKSMISCDSPFYPSFIGINAYDYISNPSSTDPKLSVCQQGGGGSTFGVRKDYCHQNNKATIESAIYQQVLGQTNDDSSTNCATGDYIQACSCIGNFDEAKNSVRAIGSDGGDCNPNVCGVCTQYIVPFDSESCICGGVNAIDGSVKEFTASLVDDDNNDITWPELQASYCSNGVSLAGIPINIYTSGTTFCDKIMREICSNTASMTISTDLRVNCQCIMEQKRLEAQFAGIDLPIQCFTTVCDITNKDVYKTAEQVTGCSARLCTQTLSVHGNNIMSQGFQEIICNGTVYNLSALPSATDVPVVSRINPDAGSIVLGPIFYISLGILVVMLLLVVVWGIRRSREIKRLQKREKVEIESLLLKTIK